jgi:dimethylargininase
VTLIAVTRAVSSSLTDCVLTHVPRTPIDLERARRQHHEYEQALVRLGYRIRQLSEAAALPDAVFVEDVAVVLDEIAVMTWPGATTRRPEVESVAAVLGDYRPLRRLAGPGTLDGGDVLRIGRTLYVGLGGRTNAAGASQLEDAVGAFGYEVRLVEVHGALHLKTAVTAVAEGVLLLNPAWLDARPFEGLDRIDVAPDEPFAANALRVGERVIYPSAFPRTRDRLAQQGVDVIEVDVSELAKAEGGVTCCSLLFVSDG